MKNTIYKITLTNWKKHNANRRKSYKMTMIPNGFCNDAKLRAMPMSHRWLFLALLLLCGETNEDTVELTASQLRALVESTVSPVRALDRLQSFQMLTYACFRNELKEIKEIKESKVKSIPVGSVGSPPDPQQLSILPPISEPKKPKPDSDANKKTWDAYFSSYVARYKVEPIRNASVNAAISNFVKRVGAQDAPEIIKFYLSHKGTYYLQNLHPVTAALKDAESLRTQWLRGQQVTLRDVKDFERRDSYREQIEKVEKGLI